MKEKNLDGLENYRPSRYERERLAEIDVVQASDGAIELIDNNLAEWHPSEEQQLFLDNLLGEGKTKLMMPESAQAIGCNMRDVARWCRREPEFMAYFKEAAKERFELAEIGADFTVAGAASGDIRPTRDVKWGVEQISKIRDFLHKREVRFIQINQIFNQGPQADQDDEALEKIINAAGNFTQKVIEAG